MRPATFHTLAAGGLTLAALLAATSTPPIAATASAAVPTYRPAMTVKQQVISAALVRGYTAADIRCAVRLITRENRAWNPRAVNRQGSSASGLWQHLRSPSGVMLRDLPVAAQNQRGLRYLAHRYGTATDPHGACTALAHHKKVGHY